MKRLIPFLLLSLLSIGCSKEKKSVNISGRAVNPVTGVGISNIGIKLYQDKSGKHISLESVRTDNDGYFTISKNTLRKENLILIAEDYGVLYSVGWTTDNGATYAGKTSFTDIKIDKANNVDLHMIDTRKFYWKFVNVNCGGTTDSLIYSMRRYYYPDYYYYNELKKGCGFKSGNCIIFEGPVIIEYTVKRNGISTSHSVTVPNNNDASNPALIEY